MTSSRFAAQLNEQIGNEFAAHQQYVACAIHYDTLTMPQMAAFFYGQALEERDHAMMMVQFLLDTDCEVKIPGVEAPKTDFDSIVAPIELALAQEKRVSEQVFALTRTAREENDFAAEQFMGVTNGVVHAVGHYLRRSREVRRRGRGGKTPPV